MSTDDRLMDLVVRWEELRQAGQAVSAEELCKDCPELVASLQERIRTLQAMDAVLGVTASPGETAGGRRGATGGQPSIPGYEVIEELGRGGMGVVYKARQVGLGRVVALKMILAGAHAGAEELARFRREVEAIASLQHPNLVQVYEVGAQDGQPYFSMEFVDGRSLEDKIGARPQPPRQAAELLETLARTMSAVHRRGIIHRDLKPANVLLTADGVPKVTDFGLAKRLDSGAGPTLSGHILGTPSYMAPEQAAGRLKEIGPATDVYALGAILYELLSGRPPFEAATPWDTILQVASAEPVPPRRLQPTVPLDLETICLKCLQKQPGRRYADAEALAEDLRRFLAGEPIRARPIGPWERAVKWARRRPTAAALLVVICLATLAFLAGGVVYSIQLGEALRQAKANAEQSRQRLVRLQVTEGAHALDEGDWFGALPWFAEALRLDQGRPEREAMHRLRIAAVLRQSPRLLQIWFHDGPVHAAPFSPDGRAVLTVSEDRTARLWDAGTGQPIGRPLEHDGPVLCGAFHPSGASVVTGSKDGTARVWAADTCQPCTPPLRHDSAVLGVSFSPDGRRVLTASADGTARLWDAATGTALLAPLRHGGAVRCAAWSRDGLHIVTASDDHTARVWDAGTGEPACPPLPHPQAVTWAAFDPEGRRVVTAGADGSGRVWSAAGGKLLVGPLKHRAAVLRASFSPDGGRVLTASDDHTARVWDAETGELAAPALRQKSGLNAAAFSPDGRRVVTAGDDNAARVWDAATGQPLGPLLRHNGSLGDAGFGPAGRLLVTVSNDNTARLWDVTPAEVVPPVTEGSTPEAEPGAPGQWRSADRLWLVTAEGDHGAQVRAGDSGEPYGPLLAHGSRVLYAAFSADDSRLVTASDDNTARIWDVGTGELLAPPLEHDGTVSYAAFSPDGRMVVTASNDRMARVWEADTGEPLTPSVRLSGDCRRAGFAADGTRLSVFGADQALWTWDLRGDDRAIEDVLTEAQVLAGRRVDADLGLLPLQPSPLRRAWQRMGHQ